MCLLPKCAGFMLLEAGNDELPEGVYVARLPSRNIQNVEVADLAYFTALKVLDLADNRVSCLICVNRWSSQQGELAHFCLLCFPIFACQPLGCM